MITAPADAVRTWIMRSDGCKGHTRALPGKRLGLEYARRDLGCAPHHRPGDGDPPSLRSPEPMLNSQRPPRVVSVNVGMPRTLVWRGRPVTTGIFKEPIAERIALRELNLDGDRQADLSVHGGPHKAVYCYP